MNNNEVLRTLRYALELDPNTLLRFFAEAEIHMTLPTLASVLKHEDEPGFAALPDKLFARFLEGFITSQRGRREGAVSAQAPEGAPRSAAGPRTPARLNNNHVLRCLKIAFELRDVDMIAIMETAGVSLSKAELSALFRRDDHRNYQPCGDQFLRNFLRGLGLGHRAGRPRG